MIDINDFRGFSTLLLMIAFLSICWWAFSPSRRSRFKEAANLPFDDENNVEDKDLQQTREVKQD